MTEFTVRGAIEDDIETIKAIENVSFPDPWSEQTLRNMLEGAELYLTAINDGVPVGYAIFGVFSTEAELYNIAVSPDFRGTGASSALLNAALDILSEKGVSQIFLEVRQSNQRAISFYKKSRFKEIGIRKSYYKNPTENAILMSLDMHDLNSNERQ